MKTQITILLAAIFLNSCNTDTKEDTKRNIKFVWSKTDSEIPIDGSIIKIDSTVEDVVYISNLTVRYGNLYFTNWIDYKTHLKNEGYTDTAAELIAKVEFNLISENDEYNALIED